MKKRVRIQNADKYLSALLAEGDEFFVALPFAEYAKSANLKAYGLKDNFSSGLSITPKGIGSVSKANVSGKFVRKQPEEKTTRRVRIMYTRKKDGASIDYMRDFNVYVKVLQHQYNLTLEFSVSPDGEPMVTSPRLKFEKTPASTMKNTHAINMFLELFGAFEIYTDQLRPALHITKRYEFPILPPGELNDEGKAVLLEGVRRVVRDEQEVKEFTERLDVINSFHPAEVGDGPAGFRGYIVFEFPRKDVVVVESMWSGNATYIFSLDSYKNLIAKNKQEVLNQRLHKKRIVHNDNWESKIRTYLNSL